MTDERGAEPAGGNDHRLPDRWDEGADRADAREAFHRELDAVDDALTGAGLVVVEALPPLLSAFRAGEESSIGRAEAMAEHVQDRCRQVEDDGFVLLARESPMGRDLRRLVALLRMTVDIGRSASLLRHVVRSLIWLDPADLPPALRQRIEEQATRSTEVFRRGLDAWRDGDALAVRELEELDDAVDRLQQRILTESTEYELGTDTVVLGLITRYFERIADHGVAVARDAAFVATGQRVAA